MERVDIGSDLSFSRIVYGMWRLGDDEDRSPAHVTAKINACLEQGITTFDQADIYGDYESEAVLGGALKANPSLRDSMEIVTKCDIMLTSEKFPDRRVKFYDTSTAHILSSVDNSLNRMGIEQIDLLLIHRPDPFMDHLETGAVLDELVASGKVRGLGVSNFRPWDWDLLQSGMKQPLLTNQIELSLGASGALTNGDLSFLQQRKIAPMAWSPLGGGALMQSDDKLRDLMDRIGKLAGVDRAAVAVAWLLAHPARILPVMGTNNLSRINSISDALKVDLDRESWFELYEAANGQEVP